jgi:hypothetical protein
VLGPVAIKALPCEIDWPGSAGEDGSLAFPGHRRHGAAGGSHGQDLGQRRRRPVERRSRRAAEGRHHARRHGALSAKVWRSRVDILSLDLAGPQLGEDADGSLTLCTATGRLTADATAALNAASRTTAFAEGLVLGTATVDVQLGRTGCSATDPGAGP